MFLREILQRRGNPPVFTIRPEVTLDEAVRKLVDRNLGSLVVTDPNGNPDCPLVGIITERDIVQAMAARRHSFGRLCVADVMTKHVLTASPDDTLETAMEIMTTHRVRHLPILRSGRLEGIISLGDLLKSHEDQLELDTDYLLA